VADPDVAEPDAGGAAGEADEPLQAARTTVAAVAAARAAAVILGRIPI
jgi:hypothetical protein